jgi:hypothetical protein
MHTSLFLGQIGPESPDPSLLDVRSIPAVALETVAQARAPSPYPGHLKKRKITYVKGFI